MHRERCLTVHSRSSSHIQLLELDPMTQTWLRLRLYASPPIALLPGVLERVRWDRVLLLLIAPRWPGRVWFPDLISLLDRPPLELPVRRDGVVTISWTQLTVQLVQCWSSCKIGSLQGYPVHFKGLCGGHKCLPHSFGWNVNGERPPGISFPLWYFEAEALKRVPIFLDDLNKMSSFHQSPEILTKYKY